MQQRKRLQARSSASARQALAKLRLPLLFKGDDFPHTDIKRAL
jgi:uncharacterized protein with PIN domain